MMKHGSTDGFETELLNSGRQPAAS